MTFKITSIPTILKSLLLVFLTITMIYITFPIANHIMGLFTTGTMMYYAIVIVYWLIIIFVTWFMTWVTVFERGGTA